MATSLEPLRAYLDSSGFSVLAAWAPVLQPVDSPDPRLSRTSSLKADNFVLETRDGGTTNSIPTASL